MPTSSRLTRAAVGLALLLASATGRASTDLRWVEDRDLGAAMPVGQVVYQGRLIGTTGRVHDEGIIAWDGQHTERLSVTPVFLTICRLFVAQDRLWLAGQSPLYRVAANSLTGTFYSGETLTQTGTANSADFILQDGPNLVVRPRSGTLAAGSRIRGARSEAEATVVSVGSSDSATVLTRTEPALRFDVVNRNGLPRIGERVRQDGTGAEGVVIDYSLDRVHSLWVRPSQGTFEVDPGIPYQRRLHGQTSGCWLDANVVTQQLSRLLPVKVFTGQVFERQLIDCGTNGPGGRPLLIWPESPVPNGKSGSIWASLDRGDTWTNLMTWRAGSIRHFHGGRFLPATPDTPYRLVLYSGDSDDESGLLVCTDLPELVEHPDLWVSRWALDLTEAPRRIWFNSTLSRPYSFGIGQRFRVLDLVTTADGRTAYWIPDAFDTVNQVLMRCDLVTGQATPTDQRVIGPGAQATRLANGLLVFNTMSEWDAASKRYGGDEYLRAWLLDPDEKLNELFRRRRVDWRNPLSLAYVGSAVEFTPPGKPSAFWFEGWAAREWQTLAEGPNLVGRLLAPGNEPARPAAVSVPPVSLLENGQFVAEPGAEWRTNGCSVTPDSTVVDPAGDGRRSLRVTPLGSGPAIVSQTLSPAALASCRGRWVTLSVRVLADMAPEDGQSAYLVIADRTQSIFNNGGRGQTNWQTWDLQHWVAPDADSLRIDLAARQSGTSARPVRFANVRLLVGAVRGVYPDRLPPANLRSDNNHRYSMGLFGVELRDSSDAGDFVEEQDLEFWEVDDGRFFGVRRAGDLSELLLYRLPGEPLRFPGFRARVMVPGLAAALSVRGRYAYVVTTQRRLLVYDTEGGDSLKLIRTLPLALVAPADMAWSGDWLLVADRERDVTVLSLADPSRPDFPSRLPVEDGALEVVGDNGLAGVLTTRRRVEVFDIASGQRRLVVPLERSSPQLRFKHRRLAIGTAIDRIGVWSFADPMLAAIEGVISTVGAVADFDLDPNGIETLLADGSLKSFPPPEFRIRSGVRPGTVTLQWQGDLALESTALAGAPAWREFASASPLLIDDSTGIRRISVPVSEALALFRLRYR